MNWEGVLLFAGGYLAGSVPTGVILTSLFGARDIRQEGSGNIGATNVYRVSGKWLGILTLVGDIVKGVIPVMLAVLLIGDEMWISGVALLTFLGHLFPIFLFFKGGKGVAIALGIFLVITPLIIPFLIIVFALVVMKWKYVSLGSLTATACMPLFLCLADYPIIYVNLSLLIGCLIFYRHRENIKRLRQGREKRISRAKVQV